MLWRQSTEVARQVAEKLAGETGLLLGVGAGWKTCWRLELVHRISSLGGRSPGSLQEWSAKEQRNLLETVGFSSTVTGSPFASHCTETAAWTQEEKCLPPVLTLNYPSMALY